MLLTEKRIHFGLEIGKVLGFRLTLVEQKIIHNLEILWHNGDQKLVHFEVSFSKDGIKFEDPIRFVSTGTTPEEIFSVDEPIPQQGRYLRLIFDHNTRDNYFSIVSLKVIGRNIQKNRK